MLGLPNDMVELWLQYMAWRGKKRPKADEMTPEGTQALVRSMFGGKGIVKA